MKKFLDRLVLFSTSLIIGLTLSVVIAQPSKSDLTGLGVAGGLADILGSPWNYDLALQPGKTLSIQEATAASACSGTLTCNGSTDVTVSTTCATTGSRIFLQRSSADTDGVGQMYVKSISNGVSFTVNCVTVADTSTMNWLIIHEAP
jgi:hypothetical protein